jgi:hypothetical protein
MTNPTKDGPAGMAMPKPADPVSSWIVDVEAGPDHGGAGHDQAGQDVVPAGRPGPKEASHGPSRLLLSRLHGEPAGPEPTVPSPLTYTGSSPDTASTSYSTVDWFPLLRLASSGT